MNELYNINLDPAMYFSFVLFQFTMGILFTQLISGIALLHPVIELSNNHGIQV